MKISFKSNKLKKQLTDPREMTKAFGARAQKVNQRMKDLRAVVTLEDMQTIPAARCHELKGDRNGQLAVNVSGNYRLVFMPDHDPLPLKEDTGLNWKLVTDIVVIEVEDYH
ncbi:MAG: type II toxin-antitoxin system RelE/ParE family toxin [Salibacteraceae bacterium]